MKIPGEAMVVATVLIVEYMDSDGTIGVKTEALSTGKEALKFSKTIELLEHARATALVPLLTEYLAEQGYLEYEDDGEESEDEEYS
jgi:hypothetical protein